MVKCQALIGIVMLMWGWCAEAYGESYVLNLEDCTWIDGDGNPRTKAELNAILENHSKWIHKLSELVKKSKEENESPNIVELRFLEYLNYGTGSLPDLTQRELDELSKDTLRCRFSSAKLPGLIINNASLMGAILDRSILWHINWSKVDLRGADFRCARLYKGNLSNADLRGANLTGSNLVSTNLAGAQLRNANLYDARFEPESLPDPKDIAFAKNLEFMTYIENPASLIQLRQELFNTGFKRQAKLVNEVLHGNDPSYAKKCLKKIFFDITCKYGVWWAFPFFYILIAGIISTILYFFAIDNKGQTGIFIVTPFVKRNRMNNSEFYIRKLSSYRLLGYRRNPTWRKVRIALLFSLMSSLRVGFREFSPIEWLRMLQHRDYELIARGWPRRISGVQSVISIYMFVMVILSLFGGGFFNY